MKYCINNSDYTHRDKFSVDEMIIKTDKKTIVKWHHGGLATSDALKRAQSNRTELNCN